MERRLISGNDLPVGEIIGQERVKDRLKGKDEKK